STATSPNRTTIAETMSSSFQGSVSDNITPTVSTLRRYYANK
ncbi:unnamed protein product, partial [Rotaria magnacalcarata]